MIANKVLSRREERQVKKRVTIFLLIIIFIIICISIFKNDILKIIYPRKYEDIVVKYANQYNIDENLIFAVIKAESNFNENAVSHKDAIGLMQIMKETAKEIANDYNIENIETTEDILKIDNNINIGAKYLSILYDRYNNIYVAVAAYNAGIRNS